VTHPERFVLRGGFFASSVWLSILFRPFGQSLLYTVLTPALLAAACLVVERSLNRARAATLLAGGLGLLLGLCLAAFVFSLFGPVIPPHLRPFFRLFLPLAIGFLGLSSGLARAQSFHFPDDHKPAIRPPLSDASTLRILDTSALIDGRIVDLADVGFIDGLLVIPQFVLNELQAVADSADGARRNRGRRGLDLVARLQKIPGVRVEIAPVDYGDVREVDLKLIEAARNHNAQVVTTDFNLSKLAQVQGIRVLNMNELATALRPIVLQGETMRVSVAKEGKESTQGLAYLEDGTVVVVDNGRHQIGKTVDVIVTGIVQGAAGKMIFARFEDGRSPSRGVPGRSSGSRDSRAS
jgi:uncharacterized protein YacL